MASQLDIWYDHIIALTKECGVIVNEAIDGLKSVKTKKGNWDLVTEYDKRVEDLLIGGILARFPDHKFIAEESASASSEKPVLTDAPTWIIDPIDGTTNFVHGLSLCCISIALAVNKTLEIGIICNPMLDELYTARRGQGAFLNGKRIHTSDVEDISCSLIGQETSLARAESIREVILGRFRAFISQAQAVRCLGSAALTLAFLSRGVIDAYHIDYLQPWDLAAGVLLIEEAGGCVLDTTGKPFNVMKPNIVAAGTEKLANALVQIIKTTDEDTKQRENGCSHCKKV